MMLDNLFLEVLNLTITGSFVILGVIVARFLMLKFPKKYSYLLWAVVLFRLLCPFTFESAIGVIPNNPQIVPSSQSTTETAQQVALPSVEIETGQEDYFPEPGVTAQVSVEINPELILSILWLVGMVGMASYGLFQYLRLKGKLSTAIPLEKGIYLADNIPSPFVLGLLKPKIYLPSHLEEQERGYIIAHEQYHLKRFDHVTRLLAFVALTIHWFNPLVWVAFVLSERDMERSCDEAVMRTMEGDIRHHYANSLLRFASRGRLISATPLAFGEGDTKGRVKNVMGYKKPVIWVTLVAIVLTVCVGVGLLSNAITKQEPTFPMEGEGVADFDTTLMIGEISRIVEPASELIVSPIMDMEIQLGAEFQFVRNDAIRFAYGLENGEKEWAQLRLFWSDDQCYVTQPTQYTMEQSAQYFSLETYLQALERLPQDEIAALAGDDVRQYKIQLVTSEYPSDPERSVYYNAQGVTEETNWHLHLLIQPYYDNNPANSALSSAGDDTIHVFYKEEVGGATHPSDYDSHTLDQAISDGAFVYNSDGVISGREYLDAFEEASANREDGSLRCVHQFTPDGADEPTSAVTDIVYEDELFTVTQYPTTPEETQLVNTYQYLVTETVPPMSSTAKYETCRAYYLVNDPDVSYQDIVNGFLSSQLGAGEDAYVIFTEYIYPED